MNSRFALTGALLVAPLSGCAESQRPEATGKGTIRAINASLTAPQITYRLEECGLVPGCSAFANLGYKQATAASPFDDLPYRVNFDYRFVGDAERTRVASVDFQLVANQDYLFVFTGTLAAPRVLTWERPIREWEDTETVMEVAFGHLAPQFGDVDIYFDAPGTDPVAGQARASLSANNRSPILELESGNYQLTFTARDDPTNILYRSIAANFAARGNFLFAIFDTDPGHTGNVAVEVINAAGGGTELFDENVRPTLRTLHAAIDQPSIDLYRDGDFSAPLIPDTAYGTVSAEVESVAASSTYTFTQAGNEGNILLETDFSIGGASRVTRVLLRTSQGLTTIAATDDFRPTEDGVKVRFINSVLNQDALDIYVVEAGTDINDELVVPEINNILPGGNPGYSFALPIEYDIYITEFDSKTVLAGPLNVSYATGEVRHYIILETADPNVLTLLEYDVVSPTP